MNTAQIAHFILGLLILTVVNLAHAKGQLDCSVLFTQGLSNKLNVGSASKDINVLKAVRKSFKKDISNLKQNSKESLSEFNHRAKYTAEDLLRELVDTLHYQSYSRVQSQLNSIKDSLADPNTTDSQMQSLQRLKSRNKQIESQLKKGYRQSVKLSFDTHSAKNTKAELLNLVELKFDQYQDFLVRSHSLLHQYNEVMTSRASQKHKSFPSSHLSLDKLHDNISNEIWALQEAIPEIEYGLLKSNPAREINRYFKNVYETYEEIDIFIESMKADRSLGLSLIRKSTRTAKIKSKSLVSNFHNSHSKLTYADLSKRIKSYTEPLSQKIRSHLAELWILSRLPLNGKNWKINPKGSDIRDALKPVHLNEHMSEKEYDIFSTTDVFGNEKVLLGEVKFYEKPLMHSDPFRIKKLQDQIILMKSFMLELEISDYEIHIYIVNGFDLKTKNILEDKNITLLGPIFNKN